MKEKTMTNFELIVTNEMGYDHSFHKYYVTLKLIRNRKEYQVYVQCDNYDMIKMEAKNLTIEFLDENRMLQKFPYDKEMFQEIEIMGCQMFEEMLEEDRNSGAV